VNEKYKITKTKIPNDGQKAQLCEILSKLKKSNRFYKTRLRLFEIEHHTHIPMGTLGWQLRYKKISTPNYLPLLNYLEKLQIEFQKEQKKMKGNIYQI